MERDATYYIVDASVLPEIYTKVIRAKDMLESGEAKTINEAVKETGISRSAFYKYKDCVFKYFKGNSFRILTLSMTLQHKPGVLSNVLNRIASYGGNVLTINQNIPVHQKANVTITIDVSKLKGEIKGFIDDLNSIEGVENLDIIAQE
ncbi:ACT domain-containing protein [Caldanaerobius polysaccharolyticus]|uniref:ACT domain-containing protein n=1 Tax=Caldanaerobius polysaccharolyticus TaxID=44256 RepID=UPI00047B67E6|nr:ACT domain-containing protein [Caldanaerobius polysaccharolyticus]